MKKCKIGMMCVEEISAEIIFLNTLYVEQVIRVLVSVTEI